MVDGLVDVEEEDVAGLDEPLLSEIDDSSTIDEDEGLDLLI